MHLHSRQISLKSNMDRFIGKKSNPRLYNELSLKSNMDRFIDGAMAVNHITPENLKSNMDRFIVVKFAYI